MKIGFLIPKKLLVSLIFFCVWSTPLYAEKISHILVVMNSNDVPYQEALRGFKEQISPYTLIKFTELTIDKTQSLADEKIEDIDKPDLIYALGAEAIKWARQQTSRIPIVATMVMKDDVLKHASNVTGVSLSYPIKTQFQWLKRFFPHQGAVAILFNPNENAATVQTAKEISQQEGFKLVAIPVSTPKELPYALGQLANNIDLLLAIQDETVMSVNTAKEVLLASFRNKVPLVGLSDNWVKSGAFYALSWDYDDIGKQSAVIARQLLDGVPIQKIPPQYPRKVTYVINTKIAEHMNMEIANDLLKNAKMVFN